MSAIKVGHRVAKTISRRHRQRVAIHQLCVLDDHTLKDVGLRRGQIPVLVEALSNGTALPPVTITHPAGNSLTAQDTWQVAANDNDLESAGVRSRILIVDDEPFDIDLLKRELELLGHDTISAANRQQAFELIDTQRCDVMLLDVGMSKMDGYAVLEYGRSSHLPVIVISALDDLDNAARCIELGAEDYLPKPFSSILLKARINATLEKKRLRDEVTQQLAFIREIFGKYVPESVAEAIVASKGTLKPTQTTATILYADIEAFTSIAEGMAPERVMQMLNEYFVAVIEPITRYGGIVNQFQGDAMLVTFNVPLEDPYHADKAIKAALEVQKVLKGRTFAGVSLGTRIGINTGEVIAGNVGSGNRINYTVHGDAVNLAARLEQLNKDYGTRVLIAGTTVAALKSTHPIDPLGEVEIRGKNAPVQIFRLVE